MKARKKRTQLVNWRENFQWDRKDWFIFAGGFLTSILIGSTVMWVRRGS